MKHSRPEDLFRAEKERATSARNSQHARLLAEAKAAFDKLMAEGQAARKSGRPRKHPLPPLKTTSSRTPPRPPAAAAPAPAAIPAAPAKPAAPAVSPPATASMKASAAKPIVPRKGKPEPKGTVKRTMAPKRGAKSVGKAASARGASKKGKPKGRARR